MQLNLPHKSLRPLVVFLGYRVQTDRYDGDIIYNM